MIKWLKSFFKKTEVEVDNITPITNRIMRTYKNKALAKTVCDLVEGYIIYEKRIR